MPRMPRGKRTHITVERVKDAIRREDHLIRSRLCEMAVREDLSKAQKKATLVRYKREQAALKRLAASLSVALAFLDYDYNFQTSLRWSEEDRDEGG